MIPYQPLANRVGGGRVREERPLSSSLALVLRVPLRRYQSLRKKLRARSQLSELWKFWNLDTMQFSESCPVDRSVNEPLINYLDVRRPWAGAGEGTGEGGLASGHGQCQASSTDGQ